MTELFKHKIPTNVVVNDYLEPGSIHGNKVALVNERVLLVADRKKILHIDMDCDVDVKAQQKFTKNPLIPFPIAMASIQAKELFSTVTTCDAALQSITLDRKNNTVAAVDGLGNLFVEKLLDMQLPEQERATKRQKTEPTISSSVYQPSQQTQFSCEHGWSGVSAVNSEMFAIGRFFAKDTHIVKMAQDRYVLEKALFFSNYVTQVRWFTTPKSDSPLLAIADYSQLSVYDPRSNHFVSRMWRTRGCITSIATTDRESNKGSQSFIGVTGVDRDVTIYDCEKWSPRFKWANAIKYTPSYVTFSDVNKDVCYCAGFDNSEMKAGDYVNVKVNSQGSFNHGMSGDGRWLGMDKLTDGTDTMGGVTQSGSVFLIKKPYQMVPTTQN
jgi:hypothetical protein